MTTKKLIAIATAFSLAVGGTSYVLPESNAATTLKLKNVSKKKTMYVGKTFTIKTNMSLKKLTFKSNKKSVATVNKKGKITAKKKGTCKITVTAKINNTKTSKKVISLTVKKKATSSTTAPKATSTPATTDHDFIVATSEPVITAAPTTAATEEPVATSTAAPTTDAATATPDATATAEPTEEPTTTPSLEPTATPTVTPEVTAEPTASPEATATVAPTEAPTEITTPATGTIFVTSISFDESGVTLKDADDNTVAYEDASNMVVTNGTYVTITAPTEDKQELVISGNCSNGQIKVDVNKDTYPDGNVDLSLEGLTLSNQSDSPIYIAAIDDTCTISAKKGTENNISDGTSYTNADDGNGAIYSKDDLKIKGKGTLNVTGNCGFGILSKNDLKIFNGTINVTAQGVAVKGKDSVKFGDKDDIGKDSAFDNLNVTLTSETSDGVRSTNPKDDETKVSEDKDYGDGKEGEIIINGGTLKIKAYSDALQSSGDLTVNGGTVDLYTYQGSSYSSSNNSNNSWGSFPGRPGSTTTTTTTNDISAKGLKAEGKLTINDGSIVTDCSDDALHCAGTATVKGGTLTLKSGDDGIHSDTDLVIDGGKIDITKSYEGIEAPTITVNDGNVHIVSSDDGFNASDGSGETAMGNGGFGYGGPNGGQMWGGNTDGSTNSTTTCELYINGGYCLVEAEGDGVDSNGNLHITGGTTLVVGPTSGGNGSIDYGDGGSYVFECTGGTLMAVGSSDMCVFPTNTSNYLTRSLSSVSGENTIAVTEENDQVLSVLKFKKSAQLLTYYNNDTTASNCKVYLNPEYDGTLDDFGYGTSGSITGGTELTTSGPTTSNNGSMPGRW